ncbi:MAG TPA: RNA polymerase sigma factor SigJ [Candidatus Binatia bacterium]|nr:RNA polymerase sigma factor SigJ [Candidatus Binatia bacterium]
MSGRPGGEADGTDVLEPERGRLFGLAYRLLGTAADAEDAVQETFLRWQQAADREAVQNPPGWLTTVLTRYCLDQLRSARARREAYVGTWLPEPVVEDDPSDRAELDESVSVAMLVVLETLSPAERTVFVLHDVFGFEFEEIAAIVDRTPAACRQLASRARRHVQERRPRFDPDAAEQRRVVTAFLDASNRGDLQGLLSLLDPSVVFRADGGGKAPAAGEPVAGPERVARVVLAGARWYPGATHRLVTVNGAPGVLTVQEGRVVGVTAVVVADGRITALDAVVNPDKLGRAATPPPA